MELLTNIVVGFSIVALPLLLVAYLFFMPPVMRSTWSAISCTALVMVLVGLQIAHIDYFNREQNLLVSKAYAAGLLLAPALFFLFSRSLLIKHQSLRWTDALHFIPVAATPFISGRVALTIAFVVGAAYAIWLVTVVVRLRQHINRFKFEAFFFGLFALIAVAVLALVLAAPWIGPELFYTSYALAIGVSVALVTFVVIAFPHVLIDIDETARSAYAASTLGNVNVEQVTAQVKRLFEVEQLHRFETLNLTTLSQALDLSTHQVSELINTEFKMGFSRLVKDHRINDAKSLLLEQPEASALSIGLTVGFGSQSSFYAAFRERVGLSPAAYRKEQLGKEKMPK
ncbi:MAG: helix-turn-helix domain-containing protein [Pseudomonadota bacterium]